MWGFGVIQNTRIRFGFWHTKKKKPAIYYEENKEKKNIQNNIIEKH